MYLRLRQRRSQITRSTRDAPSWCQRPVADAEFVDDGIYRYVCFARLLLISHPRGTTCRLLCVTTVCHWPRSSGSYWDELFGDRWWPGVVVSALASINEVNQRRARLVLRWVTVSGLISFISVCEQPPRSTQPGHPFVGRRNEYQSKGGDAWLLGSKDRYGSCVGGR